jgi:hypothetical protein
VPVLQLQLDAGASVHGFIGEVVTLAARVYAEDEARLRVLRP